jgi:hypothetical protein
MIIGDVDFEVESHFQMKSGITDIISTISKITRESLIPSPKNAGPALPVPNAKMLKLQVNQTQKSCIMRGSVRFDSGIGVILLSQDEGEHTDRIWNKANTHPLVSMPHFKR